MKEHDIRPQDLMKLKEPALQHDIQFLKIRIPSFKTSPCPCCGSKEISFWSEKNEFQYDQCNSCKTIFMNPRPDEMVLEEFYKNSKNYEFWAKYIFPATDSIRKEKIFKPRASRVVEIFKKYQRGNSESFLEVGAAYGTFCESVRELDIFKNIYAVEPTPDLAEMCRQKGFTTFEETIENLSVPLESIDLIASFEVIEHLANPASFITKICSFLKKNGIFVCSCPNGLSIGMMEFKSLAREVDHEHINYFNPMSLALLVEKAGFEVLEVSTPGQLDVDLLKNIYLEAPQAIKDKFNGTFLQYLFDLNDSDLNEKFQEFIRCAKLSSHMWMVCRKI